MFGALVRAWMASRPAGLSSIASVMLALCLISFAKVADAVETRTVLTDAAEVIAVSGEKKFKPEPKLEPTDAGTLRVEAAESGKTGWRLVYNAPLRTIDGVARITYTLDGSTEATVVEVKIAELPVTKSVEVLPGSEVVLESGLKSGDVASPKSTYGSAVLREENATPRTFRLVYLAPPDKDRAVADVIYLKVEGGKSAPTRVQVVISSNPWGEGYGAAVKVMFAMFVSAALLELALGTIFGTAWYRRIPGSRGLRTTITAVVALALVYFADLDVVTQLISILKNKSYASWEMTKVLSALILAGGSAGVNALMVSLKLKAPHPIADAVRPPADKAWIAVKVVTTSSTPRHMDILTRLATEDKKAESAPSDQALGTLRLIKEPGLLQKIFLGDPNRFPSWGGFAVMPSPENRYIVLRMFADQAKPPDLKLFGPYAFAPGVIIDVRFEG